MTNTSNHSTSYWKTSNSNCENKHFTELVKTVTQRVVSFSPKSGVLWTRRRRLHLACNARPRECRATKSFHSQSGLYVEPLRLHSTFSSMASPVQNTCGSTIVCKSVYLGYFRTGDTWVNAWAEQGGFANAQAIPKGSTSTTWLLHHQHHWGPLVFCRLWTQ